MTETTEAMLSAWVKGRVHTLSEARASDLPCWTEISGREMIVGGYVVAYKTDCGRFLINDWTQKDRGPYRVSRQYADSIDTVIDILRSEAGPGKLTFFHPLVFSSLSFISEPEVPF
ncbi:MAG TPA: hypothetical protein EYN66_01630 [Myxococcales bacterium]|nr:hypothetical protein [Myxococcales bacterium]